MTKHDATTFELGEATLALRDDLRFSAQRGRHSKTFLIEDLATGDFYRVGEAEYTFLSLLDGKTTLASALSKTCSVVGAKAFDEQDAAQICKWLVDTGLAATRASTSAARLNERRQNSDSAKILGMLNPISVRIPLMNPDRIVAIANQSIGWLVSRPAAIIWLVTCIYAAISLGANFDRFGGGSISVFSRYDWLLLGLTWMVLKIVHEFAHALTCRRFGGRVRSCGVLLLLLIPLPFVDVTSAWRFPDKYHRILVSAAGMIAEIFLAAIAAIVWLRVDAGLVSQIAANVMFAASVNTLLFNANPLMKFDGYHMLADYLEMPNLAKYGNQHVIGVCRRFFLGLGASPLPWAGLRGTIVKGYGFASIIWKVLICASLVFGAANLLPGFGFLIALLAVVLWLAVPVAKLAKFVVLGNEFEQPNRLRFATVSIACVLFALSVGSLVPSPSVITSPIVIDYEPSMTIRSETTGFVDAVHVVPGESVRKGDLLATMLNPELDARLIDTKSRLAAAKLSASARQNERNIGGWQIQQQTIAALEKQMLETSRSVQRLTIKAPMDGQVLFDDPNDLLGTYVSPGTELFTVGSEQQKEAVALVSQSDARFLTNTNGQAVKLKIWGHGETLSGKVSKITPRVQNDLPHFSFAGMYGGPLTVVDRSQYTDAVATPDTSQLVLLQPRYAMHIDIDEATASRLRSGQTGVAYLRTRTGRLGPYVWEQAKSWVGNRLQETHGF
ncbi:HlyD family efflux transporter periplasmic adaptor subunit [Planctomycetes bacterium K23_9]|uniref:HlyD family secretion protein n=1 Tax=Stieleria marina TaxID=1930275 RepID=A0A517NVP3_9BACT|nr:HlyD family secretion protein [Planctomycetes bacterium K23_9]